ncbi:hypothetical protein G9C98_000746 [Cotesia typhae]|uniref:Serpin domain-containing protein n=1 Tax=Cotesia typhae TaxID=2053667 RepID=A0A8J5RFE4_9HYME|nr:hypothetical protein G9C98_000746 [Cotesia typhae]
MNLKLGFVVLYLLSGNLTSESYPYYPIEETPVNIMTDVINDLGVKVLSCYSPHHHGNVAFSPTGLTFVLAALYEASAGATRRQIAQVLNLPQEKQVTRIGLRDIHRRLRSYLNANAFLGGLTLNRDDVTLRQDYEDLLRFYGFEVNPTLPNATTEAGNSTEGPVPSTSTTSSPDIEVLGAQTGPGGNLTGLGENSTMLPTEQTSLPTVDVTMSAEVTTVVMVSENSSLGMLEPTVASIESQNETVGGRKRRSIEESGGLGVDVTTLSADLGELSTEGGELTLTTGKSSLPPLQSTLPPFQPNRHRRTNPDYQNWLPIIPWQPNINGIALDTDTSAFRPSELNFFSDGVDETSISTIMYTTVLPFCYFPTLGTAVVEFPLDDPRYTVVILLPDSDVETLVKTLRASRVKLRNLRQALTPCWIKAAIPSFMLKGFVTLTGWLQKLGIVDAFEPRAADLSIMTPDLGVYARDVHQRNPRSEPIPFIANRPFVFFIIDTETSVSLIAGRINDPLNSRII